MRQKFKFLKKLFGVVCLISLKPASIFSYAFVLDPGSKNLMNELQFGSIKPELIEDEKKITFKFSASDTAASSIMVKNNGFEIKDGFIIKIKFKQSSAQNNPYPRIFEISKGNNPNKINFFIYNFDGKEYVKFEDNLNEN